MGAGPVCLQREPRPSLHIPVLGEEVVQHSQRGLQVTVDDVCRETNTSSVSVGLLASKFSPPICHSSLSAQHGPGLALGTGADGCGSTGRVRAWRKRGAKVWGTGELPIAAIKQMPRHAGSILETACPDEVALLALMVGELRRAQELLMQRKGTQQVSITLRTARGG